MFSTFSSILPASISPFGAKDDRDREKPDRELTQSTDDPTPRPPDTEQLAQSADKDQAGKKEKQKKERSPTETFIVVRPPPSVSNHPLNLQLQLVHPAAKDRTASGSSTNRRSVDLSSQSADESGVALARTTSGRSNRSDVSSFYASSSFASTTSTSSLASAASVSSGLGGPGGGRRMIVPLYNLSAHNVMTNTVLDAGTDAKVAKFHKRGLEVLALAVLECVEVWPNYGHGRRVSFRTTNVGKENTGLHPNEGALRRMASKESSLHTPASSALSLSSQGSHHPQNQSDPPKTPTASTYGTRAVLTPTPTQSGAKKIFGKIFKKKEAQLQAQPQPQRHQQMGHSRSGSVPDTNGGSGLSPYGSAARDRRSVYASASGTSPSVPPTPSIIAPSPTTTQSQGFVSYSSGGGLQPPPKSPSLLSGSQVPTLQPAILDIQPTLSAPVYPPAGRATRYTWVVKRWQKGGEGGLLGGVMRGVGMVGAGVSGLAEKVATRQPGFPGNNSGGGSVSGGQYAPGMAVEVRFEWTRGSSKNQKRRSTIAGEKRGSIARSNSQTSLGERTSAPGTANNSRRSKTAPSRTAPRLSGESRRSVSPSGAVYRQRYQQDQPHTRREESLSRESRASSSVAHDDGDVDFATARKMTSSPTAMQETFADAYDDGKDNTVVEEDEPESDPEDSETPWTCALVVSAVPSNTAMLWEQDYMGERETLHPLASAHGHGTSNATVYTTHSRESSAPGEASNAPPRRRGTIVPDAPGTLLRLKVGTLLPAPHHPKVVAQLKVPFPLPDVALGRGVSFARARKRNIIPGTGGGVSKPPASAVVLEAEGEALMLTAEEIKDVLSCTAFWLVVREGFGGVGKVNRKGDGWRIRA